MAKSQTYYNIYRRIYYALADINYDNNKYIYKIHGLVITAYNSALGQTFFTIVLYKCLLDILALSMEAM